MKGSSHEFRSAGYRRKVARWALALLLTLPILALAADDAGLGSTQLESHTNYSVPTNELGSWIWEKETRSDQTCRLWHAFEIPAHAKIEKARLVMTADNDFTLYLDGRVLGRGVEWREMYVFDLAALLAPGRHTLGVKCYNGAFAAGMLFGLHIGLAGGKTIEIKSDSDWKIVPEGFSSWEQRTEAPESWESATVIAPFGGSPWDKTVPDAVIMMPPLKPVEIFFWQTGWFQLSLMLFCFIATLVSLWLLTQLFIQRKERQILQQERTRIARDIHDDMGGRLTQLVVHTEVAQNGLPDDAEMRSQLSWICNEGRGLLSTMDEVLWVVDPRCDTLAEFIDYISSYTQEFLRPSKIQCFFAVDSKMPAATFPFPLRRSLLMAVKEALNNTFKHSGATEVHLKIQWQEPCLIVEVRDNGRGFDPSILKSDGNGLRNMSKRLQELDGQSQISSKPGEGCKIEFKLPLKRSIRSAWSQMGPQTANDKPNNATLY